MSDFCGLLRKPELLFIHTYLFNYFQNRKLMLNYDLCLFNFQDSSQDIELCRSYSGSMLPLIFGIPFAPELKNPYSPIEGQQATLARKVLTFWANFATSG